jgi:8-amino-7-oxononanoate synthase
MATLDPHRTDLTALEARDRLRSLRPRTGKDFSSNDYLGLADSPRLRTAVGDALARGVPVGSGGSRLLRGNCAEHEALEEDAARFFGSEAALVFASGFAANTILFATLPQTGDLVVYDALIHASAHAARPASRRRTTTQTRSTTRSATGGTAAARARRGSRSRASTAWMATVPHSPRSPRWPSATTRCC